MPIGVGHSFWRRISHSILSLYLTDSPSMSKVSGARLPREALLCWLMQKQHIQAYLRLDRQKNLTLVGSAERWLQPGCVRFGSASYSLQYCSRVSMMSPILTKKSENMSYSMIFYLVHLQEMSGMTLPTTEPTLINLRDKHSEFSWCTREGMYCDASLHISPSFL